MYGTYCSETVLRKRPTTVDAAGRSSSPTARRRTTRAARARAASASTTPTRGRSRSSRPSRTSFSTSRPPFSSSRYDVTMRRVAPVAAAGRAVYGLDPAPRDAERLERAAPGGRGRARASAGARPSAGPAAAAGRRCRSAPATAGAAARRSERSGRRCSSSESVPVPASTTARVPAGLEHSRRAQAPPCVRPCDRLGRERSASCCQATSWPAGAQSVARAEEEAEGDEPLARRRAGARARPRASLPARRGAAGGARLRTTSPSLVSSHVPRSRSRVTKSWRFRIRKRRSPTRSTCTGCARNFSSGSAGCGVRSGQTIPSAQKFASLRLVAEVAAVGPVLAASRVRAPDPVVDPLPDEPALQRVVALEGGEVVGEPAVRVAHRVRVLAEDQRPGMSSALSAHATIASSSGYIGQTTSVARCPPAQSPLIAPS